MASYDDTATVSGSVVGFSNGADSVPLKNWLVTLPASLDGYTEVNGVKIASDNLLGFGNIDFTLKGIRYYTVDGVLYLDGTTVGETSSADTAFKDNLTFYLPAGKYYLNRGSLAIPTYIYDYDDFISGHALRINNGIFTLAEGKKLVLGFYLYNKSFTDNKLDACVNVGSTAITYVDTTAPTTYTASLGRTIYGGTVDIVTGEGEENCTNRNLVGEGFTWNYNTTELSFPYFTIGSNAPNKASNKNFVCDGYVNNGNYRSNLQDGEIGVFNNTSGINRFCVRDDSCTTLEQFLEKNANTKITYEATTPTPFTFTPITPTAETAKGSNTFWSDQGDSEVTYYKDGYGTTSVTIHKETPDGEPVEETRKLHRIIYEGQVDVINGTGLIYRGESGTQYDPPEQISFTPIEVSTDEGENTLYADQGDSAITYRKDTE